MSISYELITTVEASTIDELGHVNNAVYLTYIEMAARSHADSVGLTYPRMLELGGVFVVRRHEVDYLRSAYAGDELTLKTWIKKSSGSRSYRHVEIRRGNDVIVDALTEWVWIDPLTRLPKRLPREVLDALPAAL